MILKNQCARKWIHNLGITAFFGLALMAAFQTFNSPNSHAFQEQMPHNSSLK